MSHRWVVCPVVSDGKTRRALVATIDNPDNPRGFSYTAAISSGLPGEQNDWALCCVRIDGEKGRKTLDEHPEITDLLGRDIEPGDRKRFLRSTPRAERWSAKKLNDVRAKIANIEARPQRSMAKIDNRKINTRMAMKDILREVGKEVNPHFDAENEIV